MKNKILKKVLCFCMTVVVCLPLTLGCGQKKVAIEPMEPEESVAVSYDIIGGKDVMPIGCQTGPYTPTNSEDGQMAPDFITDELWNDISDMGLNLIFQAFDDYAVMKDKVVKALDLSEKYDMAYVVTDSEIINMALEDNVSLENVTTRLSEYMYHPAFGGVFLIDEPSTRYYLPEGPESKQLDNFTELGPMLNQELQIMPYHQVYPNVNPNGKDTYVKYVNDVVDTLHPQYLAMNRYPLTAENRDSIGEFFFDMAVVRQVAQENGIPWWAYYGAGSQWNDGQTRFQTNGYYPEEGAYDWHFNISLAWGVQGLIIFPLIQPYHFAYSTEPEMDFERNGCIGAWGNKNRWYYYTQDIAKHVRAVDEVLMNSVNKGVIVSGDAANEAVKFARDYDAIIEGTSWRELKDVQGEAMVGCFNYQGKTALYVANYEQDYAQDITLTFQDEYKVMVIQDAEISYLQASEITLQMLAGDGALLVFE